MILTRVPAKSFNSDAEINDKILSGRLNELLLIVPTNRKIRYLKKEIISLTPGKAAGHLNIETIGTFSTKLLAETTSFNPLSEAVASVLLRQSFQKTELKYFSHYKKEIPEGTLSRIKNVISEYKKHGISPSHLINEADLLTGSEKLKALDIASVYEKYLEICRNLEAYEIGDIYNNLNKSSQAEFEKSFRKIYPDVDLVFIMGFDEFSTPEIEIISSAADISACRLYMLFDYYRDNPLIFSHLDRSYEKLVKKGFFLLEDTRPADVTKFQTYLRQHLFLTAPKVKSKSPAENVVKITALNREKEIELIAKEIKELIVEKNTEPHKICVAFNLITHYSPFIRDIFTLYGIPFNLTDRYPLNTSKPVLSIINFLEILENDFYYKNIFRALSGGFVKLKQINLSNLLKASVKLKIIAGYENWRIRLKEAINKLADEDEEESDRFSEKDIYIKALGDIETLEEILSPFSRKMTLRQFRQNLQSLIYSLEIPTVMINSFSTEYEENIKAVTTFVNTIDELFHLFELEYGEKEKFSLKFFLTNIRAAVASARYNIKEKPGYGVQVTTLNEIRGLKFDYLFISGLTDGDLPTRFKPEIFYSGSYARSEQNHQVEERYLFYQALCCWNKKLYLTLPMQDEKRELSESTFAAEFNKVFNVRQKTVKDYSETIYSKEELAVELGKYGIDKMSCYNEAAGIISPEILNKGVYVSKLRESGESKSSVYSGILTGSLEGELKERLSEFRNRQFSISQLETYAKCPYKYFIERVLGLKPVDEPTEEIEAIEMGRLLHIILYEFYKAIKEKGIKLSNASSAEIAEAEEIIFSIAREKIDESGFHSSLAFYEKEKVLGIDNNRKNSLLHKFLTYEIENTGEFVPEFFEKSFGNIDEPRNTAAHLYNLKAGDITVRGKIDRVDINKKEKSFKVLDYKLGGKKPSTENINNAISLQLPLYMHAAREIIKQELNEEYSPAGAEIYSLKFEEGDFGRKEINLTKKKNLSANDKKALTEEAIKKCIDAINGYVADISSGKFNLSELQNKETAVCIYCDFKGICRVQETY